MTTIPILICVKFIIGSSTKTTAIFLLFPCPILVVFYLFTQPLLQKYPGIAIDNFTRVIKPLPTSVIKERQALCIQQAYFFYICWWHHAVNPTWNSLSELMFWRSVVFVSSVCERTQINVPELLCHGRWEALRIHTLFHLLNGNSDNKWCGSRCLSVNFIWRTERWKHTRGDACMKAEDENTPSAR